jgi:hypothetical protein
MQSLYTTKSRCKQRPVGAANCSQDVIIGAAFANVRFQTAAHRTNLFHLCKFLQLRLDTYRLLVLADRAQQILIADCRGCLYPLAVRRQQADHALFDVNVFGRTLRSVTECRQVAREIQRLPCPACGGDVTVSEAVGPKSATAATVIPGAGVPDSTNPQPSISTSVSAVCHSAAIDAECHTPDDALHAHRNGRQGKGNQATALAA